VADCREHVGVVTARSARPQRTRRTTTKPARARTDGPVMGSVFICLVHPIKHACVQTIGSKEDNDKLSSTRSVYRGTNERRWGGGLSIP
jgi:hypothetical protein